MPFSRLSEQVQKLSTPQQSDAFVKRFRDAVREGEFDAIDLPERFTLPKKFKRRGSEETYEKDMKDMVFETSAKFDKWFEGVDQELAAAPQRGRGKPKLTVENLEEGVIDFKALAEETRRKLQNSYEKGQNLGNSRKSKAAPAKPPTKAKRTTKK
ncbi:hypothetical protein SAMN00790413_03689 [Deinococcus hopiensis KR-140]|uniref:Uncharacterized protein n=1 Tax=Deinococcus hopiensis KR-140 TaxID=695939 RepID=A0A1W1UYC1_9DEIO|nr:hypothetical protein [Deinococcus hopiensis]SMB86112.1 hypothetical protein SAMN00790413_03689 [Deinococcus hopiensis KR-140]